MRHAANIQNEYNLVFTFSFFYDFVYSCLHCLFTRISFFSLSRALLQMEIKILQWNSFHDRLSFTVIESFYPSFVLWYFFFLSAFCCVQVDCFRFGFVLAADACAIDDDGDESSQTFAFCIFMSAKMFTIERYCVRHMPIRTTKPVVGERKWK